MKSILNGLIVFFCLMLSDSLSAQDTSFYGGIDFRAIQDRSNATHYSVEEYSKRSSRSAVRRAFYPNHTVKRITPYRNYSKQSKHGVDSSFYGSGQLKSIITFKQGKENGIHIAYYPNGSIKRKAVYKSGKLVNGIAFTSDGHDTIYTDLFVQAQFPGGNDSLAAFMKKNTKFREKALKKRRQEVVIASFVVDKYGDITHIKIIPSISKEPDAECIRVIKLMPL